MTLVWRWRSVAFLLISWLASTSTSENLPASSAATISASALHQLFAQYRAALLWTLRHSYLRHGDQIYVVATSREEEKMKIGLQAMDICSITTVTEQVGLLQNPVLDLSSLFPNLVTTQNVVDDYDKLQQTALYSHGSESLNPKHRILIVFTTCNLLPMSLLTLQYMKSLDNIADVAIVDDHSTDGTVEFLTKKGFAVLSKARAGGLTDSWNLGYRLAVALEYKYMVIMNNDILITAGSMKLIRDTLDRTAMVLPLTINRGAGHNPRQGISRNFGFGRNVSAYVEDYHNADDIQAALARIASKFNSTRGRYHCLTEPSAPGGHAFFNGFAFAINLKRIEPAAFQPSVNLFNPEDVIVGQEARFSEILHSLRLIPRIARCVFWYHFKSQTVRLGHSQVHHALLQTKKMDNVVSSEFFDGPMVRVRFRDGNTTVFDVREDLSWYHPEEKGNVFKQGLPGMHSKSTSPPSLYDVHQQMRAHCRWDMSIPLFPMARTLNFTLLTNILTKSSVLNEAGREPKTCIYPSYWPHLCNNLPVNVRTRNGVEERDTFDARGQALPKSITIAMILSDPMANDRFDAAAIAYNFGMALQSQYRNVYIRYLRQESQWYDVHLLHDVDVLLNFEESFELPRVLKLLQAADIVHGESRQVQFAMVTIAWIWEAEKEWLLQPWLGNYDLLLASSQLSSAFFQRISDNVGLPIACVVKCTHRWRDENGDRVLLPLFMRRVEVPIVRFPLASTSLGHEERVIHEINRKTHGREKESVFPWHRKMMISDELERQLQFLNTNARPNVANGRERLFSSDENTENGEDFLRMYLKDIHYLYINEKDRAVNFNIVEVANSLQKWRGCFIGDGWEAIRHGKFINSLSDDLMRAVNLFLY